MPPADPCHPPVVTTYQFRKEETRYSRRVEMAEIEKNDFNLNISRYISTAVGEDEIELGATHSDLVGIASFPRRREPSHRAHSTGFPPSRE